MRLSRIASPLRQGQPASHCPACGPAGGLGVWEAGLATTGRTSAGDGTIDFERFAREVEPRLHRALVATYGPEVGREATVDALAWAWEHRQLLAGKSHPIAYLYRVGQSQSRRRKVRAVFERPAADDPVVEPKLAAALDAFSQRQRVAVLLVHGAGWTRVEVAELLGIRPDTVRTHLERAMARLRSEIGGVNG
jgi:DNA-directed RNA polymerase specialized sigma24 family protein